MKKMNFKYLLICTFTISAHSACMFRQAHKLITPLQIIKLQKKQQRLSDIVAILTKRLENLENNQNKIIEQVFPDHELHSDHPIISCVSKQK